MSKLLIVGAGGHGRVVAETALQTRRWSEVAFLDDNGDIKPFLDIPVIGRLKDCELYRNEYRHVFVAFGDNQLRLKWLVHLEKAGFILPTIIHPWSFISSVCEIDVGSIVMAGAVIQANTNIGKGCIINTSSSVDHDCILEDGVHISPGVAIGGTVTIKKYTWIGIGSSVMNNVNIGSKAIVAAGATVIHDVADCVMVAGVPAKYMKALE